jgi:hypothetical protein
VFRRPPQQLEARGLDIYPARLEELAILPESNPNPYDQAVLAVSSQQPTDALLEYPGRLPHSYEGPKGPDSNTVKDRLGLAVPLRLAR